MEDVLDWSGFAQQMAGMARDLLAQDSVAGTLDRISASATELVEGCTSAGVLVLHDRKVETLTATDQLVVDSDQLQERLAEGPCYDAARTSQGERTYRIADLDARRAVAGVRPAGPCPRGGQHDGFPAVHGGRRPRRAEPLLA